MGKKRILLVARWPLGGIRTYFRYIYSQPVFEEYEFVFLMPLFEDLDRYIGEHCPSLYVEFVPCENSNRGVLAKLVETLGQDFDIIHSHGFSAALMTQLAMIRSRSKCPHLMTAHDVFLEKQFEGFKGWAKKKLMSLAFTRLDSIHVVSEDGRKNFLEFFPKVDQSRVHKILHGVDTERFFNEQPRDFRSELGLNSDVMLLGFFGRFMAQKGFRYIVDAIEILVREKPNIVRTIRVLSFGWGGFIREEFESIDRRGLSEIFIQIPYTNNMPAAIKGVDVVLMPSLWEACGLLGMEALSAGSPIVGTSCIGLREVLEGSPAVVVPPKDSMALAQAIQSIINDPKSSDFHDYSKVAGSRFALDRPAESLASLYCKLFSSQ